MRRLYAEISKCLPGKGKHWWVNVPFSYLKQGCLLSRLAVANKRLGCKLNGKMKENTKWIAAQ